MNIVIRTDSSIEIGTGHVMRCLTLAKQLMQHDANIVFVCRALEGNSISFLRSENMTVLELPFKNNSDSDLQWTADNWETDAEETLSVLANEKIFADVLIVDHYSLDYRWEEKLRAAAEKVFVIDDLANRKHSCDFLLDQNYYLNMEERYEGLVPEKCVLLLGPEYVLLRDEFLEAARHQRERSGKVENLFIFFGGTDPTGETIKTLRAIQRMAVEFRNIDVVIGASNPAKEEIGQLCEMVENMYFHCQVTNMAELMIKADLAIGAGGTTNWERCVLGLPAVVVGIAQNQERVCEDLHCKNAIHYLGKKETVSKAAIFAAVEELLADREIVRVMSERAAKIVPFSKVKIKPVMIALIGEINL